MRCTVSGRQRRIKWIRYYATETDPIQKCIRAEKWNHLKRTLLCVPRTLMHLLFGTHIHVMVSCLVLCMSLTQITRTRSNQLQIILTLTPPSSV